jgi:hypothetical protein
MRGAKVFGKLVKLEEIKLDRSALRLPAYSCVWSTLCRLRGALSLSVDASLGCSGS